MFPEFQGVVTGPSPDRDRLKIRAERTTMHALTRPESSPDDVRADFPEWLANWNRVSLIVDAVQTVEWPESDLRLAARSGFIFRPLVMVTVLTYCYAEGVYHPKDIALEASRNEALRLLCGGIYPTWEDIRDFSRHNRKLIKRVLRLLRGCNNSFPGSSQVSPSFRPEPTPQPNEKQNAELDNGRSHGFGCLLQPRGRAILGRPLGQAGPEGDFDGRRGQRP